MANTVDKIRVQQELTKLVRDADYYAVSYDPDSNEPADVDTSVGAGTVKVKPGSVGTNEISCSWLIDARHGRRQIRERENWRWEAQVKFKSEVTSYVAEEAWSLKPLVLPRSGSLRQVTLELVNATYEHPVRQEPHNGSRITFTFEARLGRR